MKKFDIKGFNKMLAACTVTKGRGIIKKLMLWVQFLTYHTVYPFDSPYQLLNVAPTLKLGQAADILLNLLISNFFTAKYRV